MKLNNKGYMVIEIVLASMIAFGIAYFLFDLTISLKNKSDDLQANTIIMSDRTIIENYIMKTLKDSGSSSCDGNRITYSYISEDEDDITGEIYVIDGNFVDSRNGEFVYKKKLNDYATYGNFLCNNNGTSLEITFPITMKVTKKEMNISLEYVSSD